MSDTKPAAYPYIPNAAPSTKSEMLEQVGARSVEDFYEDVPPEIRLDRPMNLPRPFPSEYALKRHVEGVLSKNRTTRETISFLGAGCYQHHVPAICDEVNRRGEFLTAYAGEPYDDHGRFQTLFEYASMMGELLNMDVVNVPTYDGYQATATSLRMAARLTGRRDVLICQPINPGKLSKIRDYCQPDIDIQLVGCHRESGEVDLDALNDAVSIGTAAIYFENPTYFGVIQTQGEQIARLAHDQDAVCVAGANPMSLGVLTPPADYGADIVCGDIQPLGMHMQFGGGHAGFIATRDEEAYVMEYPSRLFGVVPTSVPGEYGFGDVAYDRTSFAVREEGKEWVGTAAALWGITAGVYLALMGPQGMADIGESIMLRARYAARRLDAIDGVVAPLFSAPHFGEFVAGFGGTTKTAEEINRALLAKGIFGGHDLSSEFPDMGQSALFSVTEVHTQEEIDYLVASLKEVIAQ